DGVLEAMSPKAEPYGRTRFEALLDKAGHAASAAEVGEAIRLEISRFADGVGRGYLGLALAAAGHRDPDLGDPELDQLVSTALGAPQRQRVVVLHGAHAVGVADDGDLGRRSAGDLREDLVDER